jgi:hypothetical protein
MRLNPLELIVKKINVKKQTWVRDEPTDDDITHIIQEGLKSPSPFDPLHLREQVYKDYQAGLAKLLCKRCENAKVLAIVYPNTKIPWELFGRIFSSFGTPRVGKSLWRMIWFAHPRLRTFPEANILENSVNASLHKESIQPVHINGGYAYVCSPETIVIYREEEVARVLVHELLHAACTDNMNDSEEIREVLTESWAEIFLIAILAKGSFVKAKHFWKIQSQWIIDQETVLKEYNIHGPNHYAWRYTVGRRGVLERMGFVFPSPSVDPRKALQNSLRFTSPFLE